MVLKKITDYYDILHEEYPEVSMSDLKKSLNAGWKGLYMLNSAGADVLLERQKFWMYIGKLTNDPLNHCY